MFPTLFIFGLVVNENRFLNVSYLLVWLPQVMKDFSFFQVLLWLNYVLLWQDHTRTDIHILRDRKCVNLIFSHNLFFLLLFLDLWLWETHTVELGTSTNIFIHIVLERHYFTILGNLYRLNALHTIRLIKHLLHGHRCLTASLNF